MTTDIFCFYLQNRPIQTGQTGGQWYSDTSPLVFPARPFHRPNFEQDPTSPSTRTSPGRAAAPSAGPRA